MRSRSAGAPRTKGSPGTRSQTDGPSRPPASRTTPGSSGQRRLPPTSLAHLKRRASEKKWRSWCELNRGGYVFRKKGQTRSDPSQGGEEDGLAVLPAQVRACPHGRVLESAENRPDDHCWWCNPENDSGTSQTRDHLFKHYYKWKDQQAVMWARAKEATKRWSGAWATYWRMIGAAWRSYPCCEASMAPPVEEN